MKATSHTAAVAKVWSIQMRRSIADPPRSKESNGQGKERCEDREWYRGQEDGGNS